MISTASHQLQNVVVSLAVAGYATILQGRLSVHLAAVRAGTERHVSSPVQGALAASFDDVFAVAAVVAGIAILLTLTLRRVPVSNRPAADSSRDEARNWEGMKATAVAACGRVSTPVP